MGADHTLYYFLSESWKSQAGVFATNLLNLNFMWETKVKKKKEKGKRKKRIEVDLWHSCSAYFPSYDFLCVFVVSSLQRKDWTMNASSVVSHSTHQRSFNATWLSTALRGWEEPSSVRSALQVCIVCVFVCKRASAYHGFATQWKESYTYMFTFQRHLHSQYATFYSFFVCVCEKPNGF